jgi:hypothetical protein
MYRYRYILVASLFDETVYNTNSVSFHFTLRQMFNKSIDFIVECVTIMILLSFIFQFLSSLHLFFIQNLTAHS